MGIGYLGAGAIGYRTTLDMLVVAFCKDYFERKAVILSDNVSRRTRMEYEYINSRISNAAMEVVGDDFEIYIREIGEAVGYANSKIEGISENTYKHRKRSVKLNIAKKLHLMD